MINSKNKTDWWKDKSEDDQMWLMMKHGFNTPFDPKRVTTEEIIKMYDVEHS